MIHRLKRVSSTLYNKHLDALLVSSISNIVYLTGFSGFSAYEREVFLLITQKKGYVFTDGRYSELVIKKIPHFNLVEISSSLPLRLALKKIIEENKIKTVGFEPENITVSEYTTFKKRLKIKLVPTKGIIQNLRLVKDSDEIKHIKKACETGDKTFLHILSHLKTGVTEKEIANIMESFMKKHGGEPSFPTIVAFGKNASVPHHQTGKSKLTKNNFVLLDFGVQINNYCSDMTRTIIFGKANEEQKRMYNTVFKAQQKAIETLSKGEMNAVKIDKSARDYINSQGYPSIPHSLGHGIGVEVHEAPRLSPVSKDVLKNGMVFSVEPGIYVLGFGGVRIEDLVLIDNGIPRFLTHSPKELIQL